jgi:CheY-like chemotaxis protein
MSSVQRLKRITDLYLEVMPVDADGNLSEHYNVALGAFIEGFPYEEENLVKAFKKEDAESAIRSLMAIRVMLDDIHADALSKECLTHSKNMAGGGGTINERTKAYVNILLSSVTALSIDVQMALLGDDEAPPDQEAEHDGQGKEILAVDDDAYCLDAFREALKGLPYKIICVTSGKAALNVMNTRVPDLFVFDIDMPEMDGITLAKNIRRHGNKTPIIFITGNATRDYVIKAVNAGAADFIVKPIIPSRVVERIGRFL